jgi:hypothetical protein
VRPGIAEASARFCRHGPADGNGSTPPKKKKKQNKNNPHFRLADELQRITGVDLTRIDGGEVIVAQTVISEVGLDMSPWKTEAHFASWLGTLSRQPHEWGQSAYPGGLDTGSTALREEERR